MLRRLYGDGVFPETYAGGLSDVAFIDLAAMEAAGLIERVRRGRYAGYRVTEAGRALIAPEGSQGREIQPN